jgi:Trk K+ transport system NAD-binding subunit
VLLVARIVHARDHLRDAIALRRDLADDQVVLVVATSGDNTNLVIGQVVEKRWAVPCVVVRVLDPARADFYSARGLRTICPTQTAISALSAAVRKASAQPQEAVS